MPERQWKDFDREENKIYEDDVDTIESNIEYLHDTAIKINNNVGNITLPYYLEIAEIDGQKVLRLIPEWENYLKNAVAAAKLPLVTTFRINKDKVQYNVAEAITFSYTINNASEIDSVYLYKDNVKLTNVTVQGGVINLDAATYTADTKFQIKGTSKGGLIFESSIITLKVYHPCYYGCLDHIFESVDDLSLLIEKDGDLGEVTITCPDNSYIYFVTSKTITSVFASNFPVPISLQQTIVKDTITYNVYTLQEGIQDAHTDTFIITESN